MRSGTRCLALKVKDQLDMARHGTPPSTLANNVHSLAQAFPAPNSDTLMSVAESGIFQAMQGLPSRCRDTPVLVSELAHLLCAMLSESCRFRALQSALVVCSELFMQAMPIDVSKNHLEDTPEFFLSHHLLETYVRYPAILSQWYKVRNVPDFAKASQWHAMTKQCTPSFFYAVRVFLSDSPKKDILFRLLAKAYEDSAEARKDFKNSHLAEQVLETPMIIFQDCCKPILHYVNGTIRQTEFAHSKEGIQYAQSLVKYRHIVIQVAQPDLQCSLLTSLKDFIDSVLIKSAVNTFNIDLIFDMLHGVLQLVGSCDFNREAALNALSDLLKSVPFQYTLWQGLLCFHEARAKSRLDQSQKLLLHSHALKILDFLICPPPGCDVTEKAIYTMVTDSLWDPRDSVVDWLKDIVSASATDKPVVDHANMRYDREGKSSHPAVIHPFVMHLMVVRTNIWFVCLPEENLRFANIMLHLIHKSGCWPIRNHTHTLSQSLRALYLQTTLFPASSFPLSINHDFLYHSARVTSLPSNAPDVSNWMYFWSNDSTARARSHENSSKNIGLYFELMTKIYSIRCRCLLRMGR